MRIGEFIICKMPMDTEINMQQAVAIAKHTHNTWEHHRPYSEVLANTIQGKKAELVLERLLCNYSAARYISYDDIRSDGLAKHAPFDGLIYNANIDSDLLNIAYNKIRADVAGSSGDSGRITTATQQYLEDNQIFTFEIKSSRLREADYEGMQNTDPNKRTLVDYQILYNNIKRFYDYFVYPHFCRDSETITNFYSYYEYVLNQNNLTGRNDIVKINQLMNIEFDNAADVYTRVFIDFKSNEIIIPGYIIKNKFFEEPRITKFRSEKSANAIYYVYHMKYGKDLLQISNDGDLWQWNREGKKKALFGAQDVKCPCCGYSLVFRISRINRLFLYICDNCSRTNGRNKWFEMKQIHPTNM